nr:helix-turn-helix domain-containing protein [Actinomycetota bacterium]
MSAPDASGSALRAARLARSLSQGQLAEIAGVSRQAVAAVESGRSEPSLRVALVLADALGTSVEDLFGGERQAPERAAEPLAPLGEPGSRAAVAPVAGRLVATPLGAHSGVRSGFAAASAIVSGPRSVRPIGPIRPALLVAGCDPALGLLEAPLAVLDPPFAFAWRSCGSGEALELAARGLVHAAGIHVRDPAGTYNLAAASVRLPAGTPVLGFAAWRQGIALRPGLGGRVRGVADLARLGLRIVNREPGSEARSILDRECAASGLDASALPGYGSEAPGHLEVAAAVAAGLADAGIASEPAALAYGLELVPITEERFDLVLAPGLEDATELHALRRVLASPWLRAQLAAIPGYDVSPLAEHGE